METYNPTKYTKQRGFRDIFWSSLLLRAVFEAAFLIAGLVAVTAIVCVMA